MDLVITTSITLIKDLSCEELLSEIKKDCHSLYAVNDLKSEFHNRFKNRLYQHCERFCTRNRLEYDILKEVFHTTFLKALNKIKDFDLEKLASEKHANNCISAWLNTIAHRSFLDHFAEKAKTSSIDESYDSLPTDDNWADEIEYFQSNVDSLKLQQALDSLSERERIIIILHTEHNCLNNNKHLPDEVLYWLSGKLALEKGNIRVIKSRALKKLREQFFRS